MSEDKYFEEHVEQLPLLGEQLDNQVLAPDSGMRIKRQQESIGFSSENVSNKTLFPEILLILDTETTGLSVDQDYCLEVGAILFHVPTRSVLAQQSFLIPVETNNAESINKIPAQITRISQPWEKAIEYLVSIINCADCLIAHNAEFDKQWFGKGPLPFTGKKWICSMEDISWPKKLNLKPRPSVRDLALAHGVPVWNAHRALTDCIYLAEVFIRCEEIEILLNQALLPKKLVIAKVSYENRYLAKQAGFRWNDPIKGAWSRRLSDSEISTLDLPLEIIEN